jgi:hypothetical protein
VIFGIVPRTCHRYRSRAATPASRFERLTQQSPRLLPGNTYTGNLHHKAKRIAHVERVLDLLEPTGLANVVANVKPAVIDSFRHPVPW